MGENGKSYKLTANVEPNNLKITYTYKWYKDDKEIPNSNTKVVYDILDGRIFGTFTSAFSNFYRSLFNGDNLTDEELFTHYFDKTEVVFKKNTIPSLSELYDFINISLVKNIFTTSWMLENTKKSLTNLGKKYNKKLNVYK